MAPSRSLMQSPSTLGNFDVGVQLYRTDRFEFKANYGVRVGGAFLSHGGSLRVAYHF